MLSCNYLTEGCQGGWALLNGFLAENGGVVSEECAPYKATTKGQQCSKFSSCPSIAKVKRSYQLEHPDEFTIKKEILKNGMVVTDWYTPGYLKTYTGGIFKTDKDDDTLNLLVQDSNIQPNHASVLYGWGVEKGEKYWLLRNSFGEKFGESGTVRVRIGDFAVNYNIAGFDVDYV